MIEDKWIRNKSDEKAVDDGFLFDIKRAVRVKDFLAKYCRQSIGEWSNQPLELLDWQWWDFIAPLYSWYDPTTNERRFRHAGVWVGKNNGKSTIASGLSLYHLIADNEPAAQVVTMASTVEQANIVFKGAYDMVLQSPLMTRRNAEGKIVKGGLLWARPNIKTIECEKTRSNFKVMSGDRGGDKAGYPISFLIFDELASNNNRDVWEQMSHNLKKRKNSLMLTISTSGFKNESVGREQFNYASRVRNSELIDTSFFPLVYQAKESDDWKSLETFKSCNPSYGVTIRESDVKALIQEAVNEPRKKNAYLTLHLNRWCGFAQNWIPTETWAKCGHKINEEDFHGSTAFVGFDGSYRGDLTSYCLLIRRDDKIYTLPRFFMPKKNADKKARLDKVPYIEWAEDPDNHLFLTAGDIIDPRAIREQIEEDAKHFNIVEFGFDPNTGFEESRQILEETNDFTFVEVPQRPKILAPAASYFERLVLGKESEGVTSIVHPNNPVLNWCLENCATKETPDGIHIIKSHDTQRVDGIVALVIGLSRLMVDEGEGDYLLTL